MKLQIEFTQPDVDNIHNVISKYHHRVFVQTRIKRNVTGDVEIPSQEQIWLTMAMCLLTTQQRSNPESPISRFLLQYPFRFSLEQLKSVPNVEEYVQQQIKNFGGIRFGPRISEQMKFNLEVLNDTGWTEISKFLLMLVDQRKLAPEPEQYKLERDAAWYMNKTFKGFGPKQSRNFWQALGLCRYEFVLDTRVNKWLNSAGFPIPLAPMSMGDEEFYCFVSDILRDLCIQADVLPCVLDAAIFSSFDKQDWPQDAAVW